MQVTLQLAPVTSDFSWYLLSCRYSIRSSSSNPCHFTAFTHWKARTKEPEPHFQFSANNHRSYCQRPSLQRGSEYTPIQGEAITLSPRQYKEAIRHLFNSVCVSRALIYEWKWCDSICSTWPLGLLLWMRWVRSVQRCKTWPVSIPLHFHHLQGLLKPGQGSGGKIWRNSCDVMFKHTCAYILPYVYTHIYLYNVWTL